MTLKHVRCLDADSHKDIAWCGETIPPHDVHFRCIETLIYHKLFANRDVPCELCVDKIKEVLNR